VSAPTPDRPEPEQILDDAGDPGFLSDLYDFLRTSKKWWMLPILVVLLALGAVLVLTQTALAPLIYTLF
jgi:hypothetical protein